MEIKSSKEYHIITLLLFLLVLAYSIMIWSIIYNVWFSIAFFLILTFITIRFWVCAGRTFILSQQGYTVKFLLFSRFYPWEETKTKSFEDYTNALGYRQPYLKGAIFTSRSIRKPSRLKPADYCFWTHPFSFCFSVFICPKFI